jgi:lactate permease
METLWRQNYDPLRNVLLSTLVAALPILVLLGSLAALRIKIHLSALLSLGITVILALFVFDMPPAICFSSALFGAAFGLFPIGWIILNLIFLYELTVRRGLFDQMRQSLASLAPDPRVQVILIAFSFGAFLEGVAGFGTPVAITAAILLQLGFRPLHAAGLALIANTAPVAFGSLGIPLTTLEQVTGLNVLKLSAMVGRQLPLFSVLIPFWVVGAFAGWRAMLGVWPAALTAGLAFAIPQFLISNLHGPWLVDTVSGACSMAAMVLLLRFWKPGRAPGIAVKNSPPPTPTPQDRRTVFLCWLPWLILTAFILVWGLPQVKTRLEGIASPKFAIPKLHNLVQRQPPVVPAEAKPEAAEFRLNFLSATGTSILAAALVAAIFMGFKGRELGRIYLETLWRIRFSLLTMSVMLALGTLTRYSGMDATLGLALARTGSWYPFFGTLLGWLGVALTGSDTASNVLFGSLQKITAEQTGLSPILMAAANSSGGVMGKMIDAPSIVAATTVINAYGQEGRILRFVFLHSLVLAILMGLVVLCQAYGPSWARAMVP